MEAFLLYPSQCILGEGSLWHAERKSCFWVDIENNTLYQYHWLNREVKHWKFDYKISLVTRGRDDHLILGFKGGIARFNLETGMLEWLLDIEKELDENRSNDGGCDSFGRLWIGTMQMDFKKGMGSLYCIDKNLNIQKKIAKVTISNGLAWSLDNKRLYYIDSPTQTVQSFIFNEEPGTINFEKIVIRIPAKMGTPDGMTIDEEGMLWVAHYGGFGVYRWNPLNGKLLDMIRVPVPNVTSCSFAGENLDHLIITTAKEHLSGKKLKKYPGSGNVFCVKTGVKGIVSNKCIL